ncbi:MAG: aminotransferase class I/II-fold pyridoxal phosphate-dependent enzyme [Faecalibacterium sp.]|nr:aminotransferase class I/II-fold pyridoxal phosphate-dependent enzyme [Faecalibacterium sp.]
MKLNTQAEGGPTAPSPDAPADFSTTWSPLGLPAGIDPVTAPAGAPADRDYTALCRAIAARERVPEEHVVCGAGVAELLRRILFVTAPQKAVMPAPCAALPEQIFTAMGCAISRCMLWETRGFAMGEAFAAAVNRETALAYLPNPCDPTGQLAGSETTAAILDKCARMGTYLLVDESLLDFTDAPADHSLMRFVSRFPNLIVLKSFESLYAMPGVPLAYCVTANPILLQKLNALAGSGVLSAASCRAGLAALQSRQHIQRARVLVHSERTKLTAMLKKAGLSVYNSDCNLLLVRADKPGLADALAARGFLVKNCGDCAGLSDTYCRIAVRSAAENAALALAVKQVLPTL